MHGCQHDTKKWRDLYQGMSVCMQSINALHFILNLHTYTPGTALLKKDSVRLYSEVAVLINTCVIWSYFEGFVLTLAEIRPLR